jgi:hypothetical protein
MDLRGISSLMVANKQSKRIIAMSELTWSQRPRNSKYFEKPHKLAILDGLSKAIILEHIEAFNFQVVSFSIFGLYLISKRMLS